MSIRNKAKNVAKKLFVLCGALRLAVRLAAPGAVILRYHSVQDRPEQYASTIGCDSIHATPIFERQMELIVRRFSPVNIDDVLLFLKNGKSLPPRAVLVTLDDGYKDNFQIAAPILNRFGIPAVFYVLVDSVDGSKAPWYCRLRHIFFTSRGRTWRDPATGGVHELTDAHACDAAFLNVSEWCARSSAWEREELIRDAENSLDPEPFPAESELMMNWDEARALAKSGHIVGSHTMTHPNLAHVSADDARRELTDSKHKLEKELGETVRHFSYPHPALYPQWNETTLRIAEELGYSTAVTTTCGAVLAQAHPLALPRTYAARQESEFLWNTERTFLIRPRAAAKRQPAD